MELMTWAELAHCLCPGVRYRARPTLAMPLPPAQFQALRSFLCDHFDASELMHLARGIWVAQPSLLHLLPPVGTPPATLAEAFLDAAQRHGFIDEEFFQALHAARPRLREIICRLQEASGVGDAQSASSSSHSRLRLRLEVDFESLTVDRVEEILSLFRLISGDARMTIESISKGSAVFVLKGRKDAIKNLSLRFVNGALGSVGGLPVTGAEAITGIGPLGCKPLTRLPGDDKEGRELLTRWRAGDANSGNALLLRYYEILSNFFRRNVYDPDEGLDLVAETLMVLASTAGNVENVSVQIYRIALFKFTGYLRRKGPSKSGDDNDLIAGELTPDPKLIMAQPGEISLLLRAIRRLPLIQHQVLDLYLWEGKTGPEVAAILDIPIHTVRSRLRLARIGLLKKVAELDNTEEALRATKITLAWWQPEVT